MPTISMFYGIIIRMYCAPSEHNPPHFHAYYQDFKAIIDINTCEFKEGSLLKKQLKLVLAWAELRQEELLAEKYPYKRNHFKYLIGGYTIPPFLILYKSSEMIG